MHRGSWASKYPERDRPKPLGKEDVLAMRRPIPEEHSGEPIDKEAI